LLLLTVLLTGLNGYLNFFKTTLNFGSSSYVYDNSEFYSSDITDVDLAGMNNIDTVIIDWISGNVSIRTDDSEFNFYEESRTTLDEVQKLHWMRDGNKLYIRYCGAFNKINTFNALPVKDLHINIPESAVDMIHMLKINTISAPVKINGGVYNDLNIETISGGVSFTGSFKFLNYESISGNLDAYPNDFPTEINAESISGRLKLTLNENRSFSVKFNTVSGDFLSEIDTISMGKHIYKHINDNYHDNSFNSTFDFKTISGNVFITKGSNYQ